jgi:hypothetical protein
LSAEFTPQAPAVRSGREGQAESGGGSGDDDFAAALEVRKQPQGGRWNQALNLNPKLGAQIAPEKCLECETGFGRESPLNCSGNSAFLMVLLKSLRLSFSGYTNFSTFVVVYYCSC